MNILMTLLGSMGDCLLATPIAKQIKEIDYPGCRLTWLIGDRFKSVIDNNPHVDEVVEIPLPYDNGAIRTSRKRIDFYVEELARGRSFDKIFVFDSNDENLPSRHCYGTFRSIYFRIYHELYGHKIVVSPEPVMILSNVEIDNAKRFASENHLDEQGCYPILFECDPKSEQSPITTNKALEIANRLVARYPNVKCIMTRREPLVTGNNRIIDGSRLTYRENAELLNHCRLLIGTNSGITWLNASTWSKKIPMVQSVANDDLANCISYSVEMDYKNVGMATDDLIEMQAVDDETLFNCVSYIVQTSFAEAKKAYREKDVALIEYYSRFYFTKKFGFDVLSQLPLPTPRVRKSSAKTKFYLFGFLPIAVIRTSGSQEVFDN